MQFFILALSSQSSFIYHELPWTLFFASSSELDRCEMGVTISHFFIKINIYLLHALLISTADVAWTSKTTSF